MKVLIVLTLVSFIATKKSPYEKSEGVLVLTDKNYDLAVAEFDYLLVYFYAPWCGHCKRMKPDFQVVAKEMKGSAVLAAMDVNRPENSPVSRKYNITGFPTLLYFEDGSLQYPYPGGNSKDVSL